MTCEYNCSVCSIGQWLDYLRSGLVQNMTIKGKLFKHFSVSELSMYRMAEDIGGSKNWWIWRKDDCLPNFSAPKWMLNIIRGLQELKHQNYIRQNNVFRSFTKILSLQFYSLYGITQPVGFLNLLSLFSRHVVTIVFHCVMNILHIIYIYIYIIYISNAVDSV